MYEEVEWVFPFDGMEIGESFFVPTLKTSHMIYAIESGAKRAGIKVFGISYDSQKSLKKFKTKYALPFDFLSDSKKEVAVKYGAAGTGWPRRITFIYILCF